MRWVSVNSVGCVLCREQALTEEGWAETVRERMAQLSFEGRVGIFQGGQRREGDPGGEDNACTCGEVGACTLLVLYFLY